MEKEHGKHSQVKHDNNDWNDWNNNNNHNPQNIKMGGMNGNITQIIITNMVESEDSPYNSNNNYE